MLHLPHFSALSTMVYFWLGWDDEQDEYFLNPCHYQIIQCVCFFSKHFFMPLNVLLYFLGYCVCIYLLCQPFTVPTLECLCVAIVISCRIVLLDVPCFVGFVYYNNAADDYDRAHDRS